MAELRLRLRQGTDLSLSAHSGGVVRGVEGGGFEPLNCMSLIFCIFITVRDTAFCNHCMAIAVRTEVVLPSLILLLY